MELEIQERLLQECMSSPIMKLLYENPLDFGQFEDFQSFESMINDAIKTSLSDGYVPFSHKLLKEICLDIACKNGLTTFVKTLLDQGANTNTLNKKYNRAPIHFATEGGHVDTLEALIAESSNLNLQDTEQYQTALHIAVNRNDERCARLLLENGASANIPNSEGLTAIHQAAMNRQCNMVELILKEHWHFLDLDNYWDRNNQIRELINQELPELQSMIVNQVPIRNYYDLYYYLNVSDEPNFLNIKIDENFSSIAAKLLETATQNDLREAVTRILDWLEREEENLKKKVIPAAHMAVEKGRHVILRKLIKVVPEIINDLIMEACLQLKELTRSRRSDWLECMKVMLNQEGVNIRDLRDDKFNTPLHYAAKSGYIEAVTLFLNKDCYIGHMNKFNIPPLAYIPEGTLRNYFDNCSQMTDERTNKCTIEFNYRCLKPYNVSPTDSYGLKNHELQVFMYLAHNNNLKNLISHQLLSSFLYLKWYRIRHFLLAKFVLYMIFYFILNSYIFCTTYVCTDDHIYQDSKNLTVRKCAPIRNTYQSDICPIISILLIFLIFREILQFVYNPRNYIKNWMNGLQIVLLGLTVTLLCGEEIHTAIAVSLLSSWKLTIMINQFPRYSIGIIMFRTVFYNFVRLFSPYILLIVVLNLIIIFHIIQGDSKHLNPSNLVKIYSNIINLFFNFVQTAEDSEYSMWFQFAFLIFIFCTNILLMNMVYRLISSDTADIWGQTELIELVYRIQPIANFENIACMIGGMMSHYFFKNSSQVFDSFVNRILLFRNYLKDDKITFWIHDTENSHEEFNTPLHNAAETDHSEVISLFRYKDCYFNHSKFNILSPIYIPKGTLAEYLTKCLKMRTAK